MKQDVFQIAVPDSVLHDLHERLQRTRWNDAVEEGWAYGTDRTFLQALMQHWSSAYRWEERQSILGRLPHRRASIDGFGLHFLHFRGGGRSPQPLLLMNGWPSSFVEYQRLAPMLANASKVATDSEISFDVVIPALPGFGFSDKPTRPNQVDTVNLFFKLMTEALGYSQFIAAGTDIGAGVATRLGLKYPQSVKAIHITAVVDPPFTPDFRPFTQAEQDYRARSRQWDTEEGAYQALQSTRPQTLAFSLADSPVGLASWIIEKFYNWSDCRGDLLGVFPMDTLIDNLMVYWSTNTIGSSVRYYYESRHFRPPLKPGDRVAVPTGVMVLPKDLAQPPREWAERFYNVQRYSVLDRGGHFPAWEVPELYATDLRSLVRSVA
ncbi:MAG: epoxide hydrolase family protein [Acidobacteriaceae bacterium]